MPGEGLICEGLKVWEGLGRGGLAAVTLRAPLINAQSPTILHFPPL